MKSKISSNLLLWGALSIILTIVDLTLPDTAFCKKLMDSWVVIWLIGIIVLLFSRQYDFFFTFKSKYPQITYYLKTIGWIPYAEFVIMLPFLSLVVYSQAYSEIFGKFLLLWLFIKMFLVIISPIFGFLHLRKQKK